MSEHRLYVEEELLPLSGIQHFAFCERQWALIHIERQWAESVRTVEGRHLHDRAHNPLIVDADDSRLVARAVPLVSYTLGLIGQADVVEFLSAQGDAPGIPLPGRAGIWHPRPVEYKRGQPKPDDRDAVQLCAQAICLEEMLGSSIAFGDLYYGQTRRRERVPMDAGLRSRAMELAERMHALFDEGRTPRAVKGKHCGLCSMTDICNPNLTIRPRSVKRYVEDEIGEQE